MKTHSFDEHDRSDNLYIMLILFLITISYKTYNTLIFHIFNEHLQWFARTSIASNGTYPVTVAYNIKLIVINIKLSLFALTDAPFRCFNNSTTERVYKGNVLILDVLLI